MTSRRSFLAALAATLAVKPESLIGQRTTEIPQPLSLNPVNEQWWNEWAIQDAVTITPQRAVDDVLFSSPIPDNFAIRGIQWGIDPSISLRDMQALLESLEIAFECDSRRYLAGPLRYFPTHGGGNNSIWPQITPRKSTELIVRADPCDLTLPATVHFQLSGICRMPELS